MAETRRAREGFAGHGEQADIRGRRHGGRKVPCAGVVERLPAVI